MNRIRKSGYDTSELLTVAFEKVNLASSYHSKGELELSLQIYEETTIFLRHIINKTENTNDLYRLNKMYNLYNKRMREISKNLSYAAATEEEENKPNKQRKPTLQNRSRHSLKLPSKEYCLSKQLPTMPIPNERAFTRSESKNIEQSNIAEQSNRHDMTTLDTAWETKVNSMSGSLRYKTLESMRETISKRIKSLDKTNIMTLKKIMHDETKNKPDNYNSQKEKIYSSRQNSIRKSNKLENIVFQKEKAEEVVVVVEEEEKPKHKGKEEYWNFNDSPKSLVLKKSPFTKRLVIKVRDPESKSHHDSIEKKDMTLFLENPYKALDRSNQKRQQLYTTFVLIHRIQTCLTCGGYLTDKLHIPIDIWYQSNIRLPMLTIKIKECNTISALLENLEHAINLDNDIIKALLTLEHALQNVNSGLFKAVVKSRHEQQELSDKKKNKKEEREKEEEEQTDSKTSQHISLWGSEITKYIKRINPSYTTEMKTNEYLDSLVRLFTAAKALERWYKKVSKSSDEAKQIYGRCLKLFSNVFCNFVIKDCLVLLDEWIRNGKNCIIE